MADHSAHQRDENGECLTNLYGKHIVEACHFDGPHEPFMSARSAPECACGWTRFHTGTRWVEMHEHLSDMAGEPTRG